MIKELYLHTYSITTAWLLSTVRSWSKLLDKMLS